MVILQENDEEYWKYGTITTTFFQYQNQNYSLVLKFHDENGLEKINLGHASSEIEFKTIYSRDPLKETLCFPFVDD